MSTISRRIEMTDTPVIVSMQQMLRGKEGVLSLAQGIVHWSPPDEAVQAARAAVDEPNTSLYGADDGLPELRAALKLKLAEQNGIVASEVMVTAGANQAYTNVVLALLDAGDPAMLFRPYYFNHLMALQMTGSAAEVLLPPSTADMLPDIEQLRSELQARAADGRRQVKMVTLVNPGNPTGVMIPRATIEAFSELCAQHGVWLVLDNTYEHFSYAGEAAHSCLEAPHIINVRAWSFDTCEPPCLCASAEHAAASLLSQPLCLQPLSLSQGGNPSMHPTLQPYDAPGRSSPSPRRTA